MSAAGSTVAFSPGNLSTSSSASSTLGSPENEEYILSFETIDKMRRVSSYSALNSLIGESSQARPAPTQPVPWTAWAARGEKFPRVGFALMTSAGLAARGGCRDLPSVSITSWDSGFLPLTPPPGDLWQADVTRQCTGPTPGWGH